MADDTPMTPAGVLAMAADGSGIPFMTFKAAAKTLLGDTIPATKPEIVTALEELATAPEPRTTPVAKKPSAPKGTPIRLIRDTWRGEDRITADGNVTLWPLDDAKRLIGSGVAERADPLPGEE